MEHETPEVLDGEVAGTTPEDVAVLYSWANLQNAKYRDFSAARREYRAAMRHRAAEEQRLAEAAAQAEAEHAAAEAERAAREAEEAARLHETAARRAAAARHTGDKEAEEAALARALHHAQEMSRIAAAERIEAARRAEAVAVAEAASRREAREMEEARISAERQAARYADSEHHRHVSGSIAIVPGQISDPYVGTQQALPGRIYHQPSVPDEEALPARHIAAGQRLIMAAPELDHGRMVADPQEFLATGDIMRDAEIAVRGTTAIVDASHKPQGLVRNLYTEPDSLETRAAVDEYARRGRDRQPLPRANRPAEPMQMSSAAVPVVRDSDVGPAYLAPTRPDPPARPSSKARPVAPYQPSEEDGARSTLAHSTFGLVSAKPIQFESTEPVKGHRTNGILGLDLDIEPDSEILAARRRQEASRERQRIVPPVLATVPVAPPRRPVPPPVFSAPPPPAPEPLSVVVPVAAPVTPVEPPVKHVPPPVLSAPPPEPSAQQRAYAKAKADAAAKAAQAQEKVDSTRRIRGYAPDEASGFFAAYGSARAQQVAPGVAEEPGVPAWLDPTAAVEPAPAKRKVSSTSSGAVTVATKDSLQASRERVAARWYALKGVFDHGIQEIDAERERRQNGEKQAPMVAIFSLAGGVGKTTMVATLGRALSSTGERVLLTDTTSHGLLPFYFGASELPPGVMRTFSPPSGSADAAICLLSYDVLQRSGDQASQDWFATEIRGKSNGMARVVLDLSSASPWVAGRISRMDATILIPLAPDMNSVISLGAMEKFFAGMKDSSGKTVQPYYLMNMFDSSLPLHLDVREVLRQQLGDRLLPLQIRRSGSIPEALAEGMTVIDYAPDSAVAEDYRNLASWLKAHAAPALVANSNARWSER